MFGDFSRFTNDPELGLTGVYLSQGSPLLDSDWNEQVAGLTEWITVLGRLAGTDATGKEQVRGIGFAVIVEGEQVTVAPGIALLGGRMVQSQSEHKANRQQPRDVSRSRRIFWDGLATNPPPGTAYLSVTSRILPASGLLPSLTPLASDAMCDITDWSICLSDSPTMPAVRTIGDGQFLVPRLKVISLPHAPPFGTCLVEYHGKVPPLTPCFKMAQTPYNILPLHGVQKLQSGVEWPVPAGGCRLLDVLENTESDFYAEYEDDHTAHLRSIKALRPDKQPIQLDDVAPLFKVKARRVGARVYLKIVELMINEKPAEIPVAEKLRPILRLWNETTLVPGQLQVREVAVATAGQYLIAGDRWYVTVANGRPVSADETVPAEEPVFAGHRVFRGVAKLDDAGLKEPFAASSSVPVPPLEEAPLPIVASRSAEMTSSTETVSAPLDRPFSDSLHRLTSALNATRMLTRNTPCKELQTRVSCLPLRRWLAAAYVHEIADLDLDTFLAKVQRSIEILPEEEHRFRDQAALVLEEARRIGGSLEPETSLRWA